jgi:hypothetical protein
LRVPSGLRAAFAAERLFGKDKMGDVSMRGTEVIIFRRLLALVADQRGVPTLEYGLISALVVLVAIFSLV